MEVKERDRRRRCKPALFVAVNNADRAQYQLNEVEREN